mmetsp:Transcript_9489/g.14545  ORF Transcript_9489/g.14545 Transcript_9489/m.14545 type:complete len:114 (+) Transcript_9489:182-523(+)
MARSVIPGQFIGNTRKLGKTQNLAQSVGLGLGDAGSLQALGSLKVQAGILGDLADDANLPKDFSADKKFNLMNFCELCDRTFSKLKGISRHHCRKCNKSVCNQCSNSRRKLSK